MRLNTNFITYDTDNKPVMLATGSSTFARKEETTLEVVLVKYNPPKDVIDKGVRKIINSLIEIGVNYG